MTTQTRVAKPQPIREVRAPAQWLALCAAAGPVILTVAWFVLGLTRPAVKTAWGVSGGLTGMITQPFSGLGLGPNGYLMNAAFLLNGLLLLAGLYGVFKALEESGPPRLRIASWALLSLSGVGSLVDGVFTVDHFMLHMLGFLLGGGLPVVSFVVAGLYFRRLPGKRGLGNWLIASSPVTLVLIALFFITFRYDDMAAGVGVAGLVERILTFEVFAPFIGMAWLAFRTPAVADR